MTRAVTNDELTKLRASSGSELYIAIWKPEPVFACRVNGTPSSNDGILQLAYNRVTIGSFAVVVPGMTCYVGSTAGAHDKGIVRVRRALTDSIFYIGETSEVQFADNDYLTVVRDFGIHPRHIRRFGTGWRIDAVSYSNQHANCAPVVNLGPLASVLWLDGENVSMTSSAFDSWCVGADISSYSHACPGAVVTNGNQTDATLTFGAVGQYLRSCTVASAGGVGHTGYRYVWVFDDDHMPISCELTAPPMGSREEGGWSFGVRLLDSADMSDVRDRALVALFTKDYPQVDGPVTDHANILAVGWIDGESIEYNAEFGTVTFDVHGPHFWLDKINAFAVGLKDTTSVPNSWLFVQGLTVDKAIWHFLHWRCTASNILDIYPTWDDRRISATEAALGGLWQQLSAISGAILAKPCTNRYGQLYTQIPTNLTPVSDRVNIPTVMDLTRADWHDSLEIQRRTRNEVGQIEISGIAWTGSVGTPLFSRAPGKVMALYGSVDKPHDTLALSSQAQCNELCGLVMGDRNNRFPVISFELAQNNRFIDIAPNQYVHLDVEPGDTPRGIALSLNTLPVRVQHNLEDGAITTEIEVEGETDGTAFPGQTYIPPSSPADNSTDPFEPGLPGFDPLIPPYDWFPPIVPPDDGGLDPEPSCLDVDAEANTGGTLWPDKWELRSDDPEKLYAYIWYPCTIRPGAATNKTTLYITGMWYRLIGGEWQPYEGTSWWKVHAIDGAGNTLISGVLHGDTYVGYQMTKRAVFSPASALQVAGFKIEIEGAEGSGVWFGEGKGFIAASMEQGFGGYGIYQGEVINSITARYYREYTFWGGTQQWPNCFPHGTIQYGGAGITEIVLEMLGIGWNGNMFTDWDCVTRWYPFDRWYNNLGQQANPTITHLGGFTYKFVWSIGSTVRTYGTEARGARPVGSLQRYHWDVLIRSINGEEPPDITTQLDISKIWIENVCAA